MIRQCWAVSSTLEAGKCEFRTLEARPWTSLSTTEGHSLRPQHTTVGTPHAASVLADTILVLTNDGIVLAPSVCRLP